MIDRRNLRFVAAAAILAVLNGCGARAAIDRGMSSSADTYDVNPQHAILVWNYDALPETARFCPVSEDGALHHCAERAQLPVIGKSLSGFTAEMDSRRASTIIRGENADYRVFSTPVRSPGRYAFIGAYQQSLKKITAPKTATYVIDVAPGTVVVMGNGMAGDHGDARKVQTLEAARATFAEAFGERADGFAFVLADFKKFERTAAAE